MKSNNKSKSAGKNTKQPNKPQSKPITTTAKQPTKQQVDVSKTSAKTDVCQVSKVFTEQVFERGSTILDYGGGRCDKNIEYMKKKGCTVLVYDPYNRDKAYNDNTWATFEKVDVQYITCNNVLNVIKDDREFVQAIRLISGLAKIKNAKVIFSIYEGDGSGIGKKTTKGWQRNCRLYWYKTQIEGLHTFEHVYMKDDVLTCY